MLFQEAAFDLKDGQKALLRSPCEEDAEKLLRFIIQSSGETDFLLKSPEEWANFSVEQEKAFLNEINNNENKLMIVCFLNDKVAGNCQISFYKLRKNCHRATVAIAVLREYWNLGIGTKMFEKMIETARSRKGMRQIELNFIEGNTRARSLYEKMGFRITGVMPDAVCLKDGTFVNEYMMVKKL